MKFALCLFSVVGASALSNPASSAKSCADLGLDTFATAASDQNGSAFVCSASRVTKNSKNPRGSTCSGKVNFNEAVDMCTSLGARLCTSAELSNDEGARSGCGLDFARIWTGTESDCPAGQSTSQAGASAYLEQHPAKCTQKGAYHFVRCCADACPDVCADDPCNSRADGKNQCVPDIQAGTGASRRQFPTTSYGVSSYSSPLGAANAVYSYGANSYSAPGASYVPSFGTAYTAAPVSYGSSGLTNTYSSFGTPYGLAAIPTMGLANGVSVGTRNTAPQCLNTYTCKCADDFTIDNAFGSQTCSVKAAPVPSPSARPASIATTFARPASIATGFLPSSIPTAFTTSAVNVAPYSYGAYAPAMSTSYAGYGAYAPQFSSYSLGRSAYTNFPAASYSSYSSTPAMASVDEAFMSSNLASQDSGRN